MDFGFPNFLKFQLINTLIRIFRDTCPTKIDASSQTFAAELLLKTVVKNAPNQNNILTLLLRSLAKSPLKSDHEKLAYFYALIDQLKTTDAGFREQWKQMRSFKIFRANYNQKALSAYSSVFRGKFMGKTTTRIFNLK